MKKISVLIVIGNLDIGGAEQHLLRVMPSLQTRELDMCVYTTNRPGVLAPAMIQAGVPVIAPQYAQSLNRWIKPLVYTISVLKLYRLLRQQRPDIVHFYLPGAYLLGGLAAWLARHPCTVMSRRIIYRKTYRRSLFFRLEKWLHKRLRFALACSQAIYHELRFEGIPTQRLGIIYNGVDATPYLSLSKHEARKSLHLSEATLVITIIANLYPYKAHRDLLQALALIQDQLPNPWQLLVVGRDGGERQRLEVLTQTLGLQAHVRFLGQRQDVPQILAAADFGVSASHEEGFSNAVLESMACGLPMVVTDISGNNEAIVNGENGFVVPKANPKRLAEALIHLAKDPALRQTMAQKTRHIVQTRFSLSKTIDDYEAFYKRLAQDPALAHNLFEPIFSVETLD